MLNTTSPTWLLGGWFGALAALIASVSMDATLPMSALLLMMGMAPAILTLLTRAGTMTPSTVEGFRPATVRPGAQTRG